MTSGQINMPEELPQIAVTDEVSTYVMECNWSAQEFIVSQSYIGLLLLMLLCFTILNRNVKRNYKETKWLMSTALMSIPIWIAWVVAYLFIPPAFRDTIIVMELLCCGTIVLCFMFGPKVYILLKYEPVLAEYPPGYGITPLEKDVAQFEKAQAYAGMYDAYERDEAAMVADLRTPITHNTMLSGRAVSPVESTTSSRLTGTTNGTASPDVAADPRKKMRNKRPKSISSSQSQSPEPHTYATPAVHRQ
jgi:hypothetical protein